jgi:hypothetical protein
MTEWRVTPDEERMPPLYSLGDHNAGFYVELNFERIALRMFAAVVPAKRLANLACNVNGPLPRQSHAVASRGQLVVSCNPL